MKKTNKLVCSLLTIGGLPAPTKVLSFLFSLLIAFCVMGYGDTAYGQVSVSYVSPSPGVDLDITRNYSNACSGGAWCPGANTLRYSITSALPLAATSITIDMSAFDIIPRAAFLSPDTASSIGTNSTAGDTITFTLSNISSTPTEVWIQVDARCSVLATVNTSPFNLHQSNQNFTYTTSVLSSGNVSGYPPISRLI